MSEQPSGVTLKRWQVAVGALALFWAITTSSVSAFSTYNSSQAIQAERISDLQLQVTSLESQVADLKVGLAEVQKQEAVQVALLQDLKEQTRRTP